MKLMTTINNSSRRYRFYDFYWFSCFSGQVDNGESRPFLWRIFNFTSIQIIIICQFNLFHLYPLTIFEQQDPPLLLVRGQIIHTLHSHNSISYNVCECVWSVDQFKKNQPTYADLKVIICSSFSIYHFIMNMWTSHPLHTCHYNHIQIVVRDKFKEWFTFNEHRTCS